MPINQYLLRKIATRIEAQPEQYNQSVWFRSNDPIVLDHDVVPVEGFDHFRTDFLEGTCGTRACVAGHAVVMADPAELAEALRTTSSWVTDAALSHNESVNVEVIDWSATAEAVLGLPHEVARFLFSGSRDETFMPVLLRTVAQLSYRHDLGDEATWNQIVDVLSSIETAFNHSALPARLES